MKIEIQKKPPSVAGAVPYFNWSATVSDDNDNELIKFYSDTKSGAVKLAEEYITNER